MGRGHHHLRGGLNVELTVVPEGSQALKIEEAPKLYVTTTTSGD